MVRDLRGPEGRTRQMRNSFSNGPGQQLRSDFSNRPGRAGKREIRFPTVEPGKKKEDE